MQQNIEPIHLINIKDSRNTLAYINNTYEQHTKATFIIHTFLTTAFRKSVQRNEHDLL